MRTFFSLHVPIIIIHVVNVRVLDRFNRCPIAMRMAWHAAGTYDAATKTGGTNGGTMRFTPESTDPSNAGLSIIRDLLHPVKAMNPEHINLKIN